MHKASEWVQDLACHGCQQCTYRPLRRWRLAEQAGSLDDAWRNYASLDDLSDKVFDIVHDQANRGQVIVLPDVEVKDRCPILVEASLGAIRKDNASLI